MNDASIITDLNAQWPDSVKTLGGAAENFNQKQQTLEMSFIASSIFCHSGDIVQGGYVTGMLDAAMAYTLIGIPGLCQGVATLEIKANFISPGHPGPMRGFGRVVHCGRSIAYLSGELYQQERLVATATSTVKLIRRVKS